MKAVCSGLFLVLSSAAAKADATPPIKHPPPPVRHIVCALNTDGSRANYPTSIAAGDANARILHLGYCEAPGKELSMCNMLYKPVCATDPVTGKEKTYPNLCHTEVANATLLHDLGCQPAKSDPPPG